MDFIKDIVFYNPDKDYGENNKKYKLLSRVYIYTLLIVMGILMGILALAIVSEYGSLSSTLIFSSYFTPISIAFYNILPGILLILALYFLTGRAFIAYGITSFLVLGVAVAEYIKLLVRGDPFIAADISILAEAGNMASRYTIDITWRIWLPIAAIILGTLFAFFFMKTPKRDMRVHICLFAGTVIIAALCYNLIYASDAVYENTKNARYGEMDLNAWSSEHKYISCGIIYPFIHSIKDAFPSPPEGYNEKTAEQIFESCTYTEISDGEEVNIISVMLEAYTDLSRFSEFEIDETVYAPLHNVIDDSVSGMLISNTFGGGTIDSERTFLTGYTYTENFRKNINSHVRYLNDNGYYTEGFHAGNKWFYNRQNVNEYLGFNNYYFLEDIEGADRTDEFFFKQIRKMYDNRDKTAPYFSYNLSYQNHGGYDSTQTCETRYILNENLSDYSVNILNNYLEGIADTSERIEEFVYSFKDDPEPVVIVMFGDHMPWMGDGNRVLTEAGINLNTQTEDGFYNYFGTMYFIWANDAAKEMTGCDFKENADPMSACFLMAKLFSLCGYEGDELMSSQIELLGDVSVINTASGGYVSGGRFTPSLQSPVLDRVRDYEYLQYYVMHESVFERKGS